MDFEHDFFSERRVVSTVAVIQMVGIVLAIILSLIPGTSFLGVVSILALLVIIATLVGLNLLYRKYRSLPISLRKFQLQEQKSKMDADIKANNSAFANCVNQRQKISEDELAAKTLHRQDYDKQAADIKSRLAKIDEDEITEKSNALQKLQANFINAGLRNNTIQKATIPGIGQKMKDRLIASSIVSVNDVSFASIIGIEGFGRAKALTVVMWAKLISDQVNRSKPSKLPTADENEMRERFGLLRIQQRGQNQEAIKRLEADLASLTQAAMTANSKNDEEEKQAKILAEHLKTAGEPLTQVLNGLRNITFSKYFKKCLQPGENIVGPRKLLATSGIIALLLFGTCGQLLFGAGSTMAYIVNSIPTNTSTPTITPTATSTQTPTNTSTSTLTSTPTETLTPTFTNTSTITNTPTITNTSTITNTPTKTSTPTRTSTATRLPTSTRWPTATTDPNYIPPPPASGGNGSSGGNGGACDPSYPTVCIPPPPPDLDCGQVSFRNFKVLPPDPHRFDADHDGIGCES